MSHPSLSVGVLEVQNSQNALYTVLRALIINVDGKDFKLLQHQAMLKEVAMLPAAKAILLVLPAALLVTLTAPILVAENFTGAYFCWK